jgi:hypothetical protein
MKVNVFDINFVKEWCSTSKDFLAVCKKPGFAAPSEDPEVLTKWMVSGMYVLILSRFVNLASAAIGNALVPGIINFLIFVVVAFLQTWIFWFAFVKRQPSCCFVCVVCIEDLKPMHLIAGIFFMLSGVLQFVGALATIQSVMLVGGLYMIVYFVVIFIMLIYSITMVGTGVCLVKMGAKKAGVELPSADNVKIGA